MFLRRAFGWAVGRKRECLRLPGWVGSRQLTARVTAEKAVPTLLPSSPHMSAQHAFAVPAIEQV